MGAIKIKSISPSHRAPILIKRKRVRAEDSSALVSLSFILGNKKITQSRKIYDALTSFKPGVNKNLSIHLNKLNEEFLGLKKAYIFDEISMDIKVNTSPVKKIPRRKIVLSKRK